MKKALKKANKSGGKTAKALAAKWTNGRYATWNIKIFYNELNSVVLKSENNELRGEKRKLEEQLDNLNCKSAKLQNTVQKLTNKLSNTDKKFKKLAQKLLNSIRDKKTSRGPDKNKSYCDYSKKHQKRIKDQLAVDCGTALSFLGLYDFLPTEVKVFNFATEQYDTLMLVDENLQLMAMK